MALDLKTFTFGELDGWTFGQLDSFVFDPTGAFNGYVGASAYYVMVPQSDNYGGSQVATAYVMTPNGDDYDPCKIAAAYVGGNKKSQVR